MNIAHPALLQARLQQVEQERDQYRALVVELQGFIRSVADGLIADPEKSASDLMDETGWLQ